MGGKTAMLFATLYPELVSKLLVADISPRFYPIHHDAILNGDSAQFDAIKKITHETGALSYTMNQAEKQAELAINSLDCLTASEYKEALICLAQFSVQRSR